MAPWHHYQTKQLALRTGMVFPSSSSSLFFFLAGWLARKMKMFNGKNKILTFLSLANVIQFVLLVRKLK